MLLFFLMRLLVGLLHLLYLRCPASVDEKQIRLARNTIIFAIDCHWELITRQTKGCVFENRLKISWETIKSRIGLTWFISLHDQLNQILRFSVSISVLNMIKSGWYVGGSLTVVCEYDDSWVQEASGNVCTPGGEHKWANVLVTTYSEDLILYSMLNEMFLCITEVNKFVRIKLYIFTHYTFFILYSCAFYCPLRYL